MNPFKVIRKSTTEKGDLAKTRVWVYEDRIFIQQLFLCKKKDKTTKLIYKKFGMYLHVNEMAFRTTTFIDFSNTLINELVSQGFIIRSFK